MGWCCVAGTFTTWVLGAYTASHSIAQHSTAQHNTASYRLTCRQRSATYHWRVARDVTGSGNQQGIKRCSSANLFLAVVCCWSKAYASPCVLLANSCTRCSTCQTSRCELHCRIVRCVLQGLISSWIAESSVVCCTDQSDWVPSKVPDEMQLPPVHSSDLEVLLDMPGLHIEGVRPRL